MYYRFTVTVAIPPERSLESYSLELSKVGLGDAQIINGSMLDCVVAADTYHEALGFVVLKILSLRLPVVKEFLRQEQLTRRKARTSKAVLCEI